MSTTITGYSDDLIEIDGDISEEIVAPYNGESFLAFSDGTLLKVWYDEDGIWRIKRIFSGTSEFEKVEGDIEKDTFDIVTLSGTKLKWVMLGTYLAKGK